MTSRKFKKVLSVPSVRAYARAEPHTPLKVCWPEALALVLVIATHRADLEASRQQGIVRGCLGHKDRADAVSHLPVLATPSLGGRADDREGVAVHARPLDLWIVRGGDGGFAKDFVNNVGVAHRRYIMPKT